MLYNKALDLAKQAMSIDTHDGACNYYYGLVNEKLGNTTDAIDGFSIATLSTEYRSAAYTELARIWLKEKDFGKAASYAERAIDYNKFNIEALQLQALAYRYSGAPASETSVLKTILGFDPLNHFAMFEEALIKGDKDSQAHFVNMISNELPQETFAELAVWYYNSGCKAEAEKVFELSPESAEKVYWLSFLQNKKADCSTINPAFAFPFRSETGAVIENLLKAQNDWILKFHLALIYRDRNRLDECNKLLAECGTTPDFAPFYVARAEILAGKNDSETETDLKKAVALDGAWRYQLRLANFYIGHQQPDKALAIAAPFCKKNPDNLVMGSLYAKSLLLNGKYREADALLAGLNIIPTEGATEGHELYREAKLMQAVQMMSKKNYKAALKFIADAKLWPENLGVGKPYDEEIDYRLENWMTYVCDKKSGKGAEAGELLNKILKFEPKVDNTVRNFLPANTLITAWAYEALDRKADGGKFIDKQLEYFPDYRLIRWSKAVYNQDSFFNLNDNEKDPNTRIIEALIKQVR
jgi:tetratricopeptide (TPR) repeat protein